MSSKTTPHPIPWADGPFALITSTGLDSRPEVPHSSVTVHFATQMALVHNIFIRGFNASYRQCLSVYPATREASDFLIFNQALYEVLHGHHEEEESFFFPAAEELAGKKGLMEKNVAEHAAFQVGLEAFRKYVFETAAEDYHGRKVRELLDAMGPAIMEHLHAEVPTMFDLYGCDEKELSKLWAEQEKRSIASHDKYRHVPLLLGCADNTARMDGELMAFPPVPFFVPYLVAFFFEKRYAGSWRFCPSDSFAQPRPLRFLSKE